MNGATAFMLVTVHLAIVIAASATVLFIARRMDLHYLRLVELKLSGSEESGEASGGTVISALLALHFAPTSVQHITISERQFPFRVRADLQRAIDRLFSIETQIKHFSGVRKEYSHEGISLSDCIVRRVTNKLSLSHRNTKKLTWAKMNQSSA